MSVALCLPQAIRARRLIAIGIGAAVALAVFTVSVEAAEPNAETPAIKAAAADAKQPSVTRADLAASYLRLEQVFFAMPPEGERLAEINKGFDRATLAFFTGRSGQALQQIDSLTASLLEPPATSAERAAASLKVSVEPPVWNSEMPTPAIIRLLSLYEAPLPAAEGVPLEVRVLGPTSNVVWQSEVAVRCGPDSQVDVPVAIDASKADFAPGLYRVEVQPRDGRGIVAGRFNVVAGSSLNAQRTANAERLQQVVAETPELKQALSTCQARNQLLNDEPSPANSAQFLADLNALAAEVRQEIEALAAGQNPYFRRPGDYWRVLSTEAGEVPLRVYAAAAAANDAPAPLVIVLHGAGGDENMFPEAYGAGIIKRIADEHGLLIASPSTYKFGGNPQRIDVLIEALSRDYAIDRERVYVLGHSMGAGAAAGLVRGKRDRVAAACCIAGGSSFQSPGGIPPLLVLLAEFDGVVPVKTVTAAAERAISAGMPVELQVIPNYGHTLVVGRELPSAVAWLLKHRRASAD